MTMKNNLIEYKNFQSENPAGFCNLEKKKNVSFTRKHFLNKVFFLRYKKQYLTFYKFFKWILFLSKERIAFFTKNLVNSNFLNLPFLYKFLLRKKFFFQLELSTYFLHMLPENMFMLRLANFKNFSFFKRTVFLKSYATYFCFKKLNEIHLNSDIEVFSEFLDEFSFFFRPVDHVSKNVKALTKSSNNTVNNFTFSTTYNTYYMLELYKLLILLNFKLIF